MANFTDISRAKVGWPPIATAFYTNGSSPARRRLLEDRLRATEARAAQLRAELDALGRGDGESQRRIGQSWKASGQSYFD